MDPAFIIIAVLGLSIMGLILWYGQISSEQGFKKGYAKGHIAGQIYGSESMLILLESIKVLDINALGEDISNGKYDHVPKFKKAKELGDEILKRQNNK